MGWSVICGINKVCVYCLCANVSSTRVGLWSVLCFKYVSFCLCANVSSTWISLWPWLFLKYESFVCALICLPHEFVCDLWYNSSMCFLSVRLCVFRMGWSVVCGILQVCVVCLCAYMSSTWVGL